MFYNCKESIFKAKKLVISTLMLFLLMIGNSYSQDNTTDYILLNKVIELTKVSTDSSYNLVERVNADQSYLRKYYNYRFLNKPFYTVFKDYDEKNDSIVYDSKEKQEQRKIRWKKKCKVIDSLFSKSDIEAFIKPHEMLSYWVKEKISTTDIQFVKHWGNYISRPYYREDNKYALVLHYYKGTKTLFVYVNNDKSQWEYFSQVDNLWW